MTTTELLDELAAELVKGQRQPGDVTARELKAKTGRSEETCRMFLEGKVQAGELEKMSILQNGHRITVYRRK